VPWWSDEVVGSVFAEPAVEPHIGSTEFLTHSQDGPPGGVPVGDVIGEGAGPADPVQHLSFQLVFVAGSGYPGLVEQGGDPGGFQPGAVVDLASRAMLDFGQMPEITG